MPLREFRLSGEQLRSLAVVGARIKLQELYATFPELRQPQTTKAEGVVETLTQRKKSGRKHPMSAAERRAVSVRMKKYWAEQRARKAKGKKSRVQ